jgi:hypothetical protein
MSRWLSFLPFALCFAIPVALPGQQAKPQRDASALSFLSQVLNASGGSGAIGGISDFTANGSITFSWGGASVQGTATIKSRGTAQFRMDSQVPDGTWSFIVNNGAGVLSLPDGTGSGIAYQNTLNAGNLTLPLLSVFGALQDTTITIIDDGLVPLGSGQAQKITIRQNLPSSSDPTRQLSADTKRDYFFDPSSFLLLQVQDAFHSGHNTAANNNVQHVIGFSNYRSINGILVPFSISESVAGQSTWSIALTSITFSIGLTDSAFRF